MATTSVGSSGSVLDVSGLVNQLMTVERQALNKYTVKEQTFTNQVTAYSQVKGSLNDFKASLSALANPDTFAAVRAAVGDSSLVTATASTGAAPGSYAIEVTQLARQHRIASSSFTSNTAAVGSGTLNFQFGTWAAGAPPTWTVNGDKPSASVTIPAGTNTLAGIRDAVNAAKIPVTATIVNDGTGSRLVFTSKDSGAANALRITVGDADGNNTDASGLSALAYDPENAVTNLSQLSEAKNAIAIIDGLTVTSASNTLDKVVDNMSFTLKKEAPGSATGVTVTRDAASVKQGVQSFVKAYNDAMQAIADTTKYDQTTQKGSPLTGDAAVRGIQQQLRAAIGDVLKGGVDDFTSLADIGVRLDSSGKMTLDATKLDTALAADPSKVARVFARTAQPSDARVQLKATTVDTQAGNYAVNITTPATRGTITGSAAAGLTVTAGVNDVVTFTIDGKTGSVTLPAGTWGSAGALAADLQSRVNGISAFRSGGVAVTVSEAGGTLTLSSNKYGSASTVSVSGIGANDLFGATPTVTAGVDVVGSIGGSAANGSGQTLTVPSGKAKGMQVLADVDAAGAFGGVRVYEGFAARLDRMLESLLGDNGPIKARMDGIDKSVKQIQKDRDAMNVRLDATEKRLRAQYSALDTMLSSMNTTSNYLTQQLAQIAANSSSSSR